MAVVAPLFAPHRRLLLPFFLLSSSLPLCPDFKLYVSMLSHLTGEEEVRALFGQFGPLSEVVLLREKDSALSKGSAFVKFHTRDAAEAAIHTLDKRYKDKVRKGDRKEHTERGGQGRQAGGSGLLLSPCHCSPCVAFTAICPVFSLHRTPPPCCKFAMRTRATRKKLTSATRVPR